MKALLSLATLWATVLAQGFDADCYKESASFGDTRSSTDILVSDLDKIRSLSSPKDYYVHDIITCVLNGEITG